MDNLTHTLVGAAIARAGSARLTPLATTTLVIASNAPDIDVLAFLRGPYFALAFRRGLTHGWPGLVVVALLVAGGVLAWDRRVRLRRRPDPAPARAGPVLLLSCIGVASHPALDWLNTYGVRWSMPISPEWSYGDTLFIIDPWIWLTLGGLLYLTSEPSRAGRLTWSVAVGLTSALVLAAPVPVAVKLLWCTGVVSVAVAGALARWHPASRIAGRIALLAVAVYVGAGVLANRAARADVLAASEALDLVVTDIMVAPLPGTPFASEVEVRTTDGYVPGTHRWWTAPRVLLLPERMVPHRSYPEDMAPALAEEIIAAGRHDTEVGRYLTWSRYPITRVERTETGWRVRVEDARYDAGAGAGSLSGVETIVEEAEVLGAPGPGG